MQQKYWMVQNLTRIAGDLNRAHHLLANLTQLHQRQTAHQIVSTAKFELEIAAEFTGLGKGGEYRPYLAVAEALEDIEDRLHNPISQQEAMQEGARLALAFQEITVKFLPQELAFGSTKGLGPEFDNKTLAQAYSEGEAIGAELLNLDSPFTTPDNRNLHFE